MPKPFCNIHSLLQHDHTERNPWDPTYEAYDTKDTKQRKHNRGGVVVFNKIVDRSPNAKHDLQDPCNPDELLGEQARERKVTPGEDERDSEHEHEEHNRVGVERELVRIVVDGAAGGIGAVALEGDTAHGSEAEEDEDELRQSSQSIQYCVPDVGIE